MVNNSLSIMKTVIRSIFAFILIIVFFFSMDGQALSLDESKGAAGFSQSSGAAGDTRPSSGGIQTESGKIDVNQAGLLSVKKNQESAPVSPKTVYLTFDDGPSPLTGEVLDILNKKSVGASFFVLGEQVKRYPELIQRIHEEGHVIGNHTYNHNYTELYKGFPAFWNQIKETEEEVRLITGERPQLIRAPGGTASHFDDTYFSLLKQGGYVVTDWNVDSGDSKRRGVPSSEIIKGATTGVKGGRVVLLMHDGSGHAETVKALPQIISWYQSHGYQFGVLSPDDTPVQFKVKAAANHLGRSAPDTAWVQSHVAGNEALFEYGKPLRLEVGSLETTLNPGEYKLVNGHYIVPLRTVTERVGGSMLWDDDAGTAQISLSADAKATLLIDLKSGKLTAMESGKEPSEVTIPVQVINDSLWVPLRDILESSGHTDIMASANAEERRVKVF